jgi:hypothetical protein
MRSGNLSAFAFLRVIFVLNIRASLLELNLFPCRDMFARADGVVRDVVGE